MKIFNIYNTPHIKHHHVLKYSQLLLLKSGHSEMVYLQHLKWKFPFPPEHSNSDMILDGGKVGKRMGFTDGLQKPISKESD